MLTGSHRTGGALDQCALEAIQFLGEVQSHGCLIEVSTDWIVRRASSNLRSFIGVAPEEVLGRPLVDIVGPSVVHDLRGRLQIVGHDDQGEMLSDVVLEGRDERLDVGIHRLGDSIILEFEPAGGSGDDRAVQQMLVQLRKMRTLDAVAKLAVRQVRALTGFDRVMVYAFRPDDSGEVVAEARHSDLPPFMGLRYPASDIPVQARALYLRNPIRLIADVAAPTCPVVPRTTPEGALLDLSMAGLRAVSPTHIQYLKNMGVGASMSISIVVDGALWGLIACHHTKSKRPSAALRQQLDFYGAMLSSIVESIQRAEAVEHQAEARELHNAMLASFSGDGGSVDELFPHLQKVQGRLKAHGMATFIDGRLRLSGETPNADEALGLMRFLNRTASSQPFQTHELRQAYPEAADWSGDVAGLLAIPVSRRPRDYVVFFRKELVNTVNWAGKPEKAVVPGQNGLSPRTSFALWQDTVRGQSEHWSNQDRRMAEILRVTLLEIVLQVTDHAERQRKTSNDQQDLLIAELNHRVRNILNLIVGLVRQSSDAAVSVKALADEISTRVHALARAHDQLTSNGWGARSLTHMIRVEAGAYLGEKADRVRITGDDAGVQPDAFATVALVMHELITNSAKYGAFRDSSGAVDIALKCSDADGLVIDWLEQGGAPVTPPTRRGFGSTIIERAIPHELGGTASVEFLPSGLRARFTLPSAHIAECSPEPQAEMAPAQAPQTPGLDRIEGRVLLVEDNLLIALETEAMLQTLGADDVRVTSSVASAIDSLDESVPAFAVLDYNLGREQSVPIAARLTEMDVPFVFATGYGDAAIIDPRFSDRPVLTKPYSPSNLLDAYRKLGR